MTDTSAGCQRLFLALWPDPSLRVAIVAATRDYLPVHAGRRVAPANLHLTLAFLGSVDAGQQACIEAAAAAVADNRPASFALRLDCLGFWPRPQVLWLGASQTPPALSELVARLNAALPACGYQPESRPYVAHMTLMRKLRRGPPASCLSAPVDWPVHDFVLVVSRTLPEGASYTVLARWPLAGPADLPE